MDSAWVVLAIVVLAIPFAVVYLLVRDHRTRKKLTQLEAELAALRIAASAAPRHAEASPLDAAPDTPPDAPAPEAPAPEAPPATQAPPGEASPSAQPHPASPWERVDATPAAPSPPPQDVAPRAPGLPERLAQWLARNWFYAVAALSLALAGIFLVQYGMERGLLPPWARVAAALGFGAALIWAGEYLRRRFGDDEDASTAYLPSVFSGAGIVSLFGGVLAARLLYGLIGPELALAELVLVAMTAQVLGWFNGPLLAAVGVLGAFAAPFLVDGNSQEVRIFYAYFALVAAVGLGIDTLRRWAWVSVLSLVLAHLAGFALAFANDLDIYALYLVALALMAVLIPARSFWPDQSGPMVSEWAAGQGARPGFATWLAAGTILASSGLLALIASSAGAGTAWLALACLAGLSAALIASSPKAPALQDIASVPGLALLGAVAGIGDGGGAIARGFAATYEASPEADAPLAVTILVAMGLGLSLLAAWRSLNTPGYRAAWAAAAAVAAPALAVVLEVTWTPAAVIGAYPWALHAMVLAAVMVVLATRIARRDGPGRRMRAALFTLSALGCLSFALVIVLSSAALTAALAVMVVAAAALDRRFGLPQMGWFIAAGVAAVGYRLIVDPGLDWGRTAPLAEMLLAYGGSLAAMLAALWLLHGLARNEARLILDSAAWSAGGLLVSLLLYRAVVAALGEDDMTSHWALGLLATIWAGMALAQVQRLAGSPALRLLRVGLGAVFAVVAATVLALAVVVASPLLNGFSPPVAGPALLNTLAPAYLAPALVLALGAWRLRGAPPPLRHALLALAAGLAALWTFAVIRHFWQGSAGMPLRYGMGQGELYTYTVALLLLGGVLFYQALARASTAMRRAGLAVIGLAVAKVFLIDIPSLGGLTRVFSLLVLGFGLAGLAWLDRWAQARSAANPVAPDSGDL